MTHSERIADFALSVKQQDIPNHISQLARLHVLDALGVGIAASSGVVQQRMAKSLLQFNAKLGGCTVLGHTDQTHAAQAALLNGSFIHALEYDDTHMASIVHGSSVLVPSALAAAEQNKLNLGEFIHLINIGWEVLIRIGMAAPGAFQRRGFQVTSVGGALVSALIAGLAAGLSRTELVWAQGIAGSQASGIFEFLSEGSTVKALHPGWAAHAGLMAAQLAGTGMTGPSTVYEGRFGLYKTYTDEPESGKLLGQELNSLGDRWLLGEAAFKLYPCCHYIHPFLEAVQQIISTNSFEINEIDSIICSVPMGASSIICEPWERKQNPKVLNEAKYSLPYCIALVFLKIQITAQHFLSTNVHPGAIEFAKKITWTPMNNADFPNKFQAAINVHFLNGKTVDCFIDQVQGSPERPASQDQILDKFISNTSTVSAGNVSQEVIDFFLNGKTNMKVNRLSALLSF